MRKILLVLMLIISAVSVGVAYSNDSLYASGSAYQVSASTTAKLGEKGIYPDGNTGNMVKGDKVYVGTDNPYNNSPLSFILMAKETYNTYLPVFDSADNVTLDTSQPFITGWFAMGNESIKEMPFFSSFPPMVPFQPAYTVVKNYLTTEPKSLLASEVTNINQAVTDKTDKILLHRNLDYLKRLIDKGTAISSSTSLACAMMFKETVRVSALHPKKFFVADFFTLMSISSTSSISGVNGGYHLSVKDLVFPTAYYTTKVIGSNTSSVKISYLSSPSGEVKEDSCTTSSCSTIRSLRLSAELDMSNVVFATGIGAGSTYSKVKNSSPDLSSYSNIYTATANYDKLKLRLLDDAGNHSITFNDIENNNTTTISKAVKDSTIYLDANATAGTNDGDVNTVSALFFKNNELAYYIPVATANGADKYELDLTGIDEGKYKIALVNEGYNESSMAPAESSALSAYQELEIVKPHKLTYTKTPQSGATTGDYEFSKNVNAGQAVGKVTADPAGVTPLTYTLETNGDNSYLNFEIDGLDTNGASSVTPLNVKIKSGAPDLVNGGLKAGDYKFCITAVDANGDPVDTSGNPTEKVCTSFTVEKTTPKKVL